MALYIGKHFRENHFRMPVNEFNNSVPPQYSLLVILQTLFNKVNTKRIHQDQPVLIHLFKLNIKVRKLKNPFVHNLHSRLFTKISLPFYFEGKT